MCNNPRTDYRFDFCAAHKCKEMPPKREGIQRMLRGVGPRTVLSANNFPPISTFFPCAPPSVTRQLRMNREAVYSTTGPKLMNKVIKVVRDLIGSGPLRIIDATANVGGSAICFAELARADVVAVEIVPETCKLLRQNIQACGLDSKIDVRCDDYVCIMSDLGHADVVFIDPPWGGAGYSKIKNMTLRLSGKPLDKLVEEIMAGPTPPRLVLLKLPANYNFKQLAKLMPLYYDMNSFTLAAIRG